MTGYIGIYAKTKTFVIPKAHKKEIQKALSRDKSDEVEFLDNPGFCLASYDIGAYGTPSLLVTGDGCVAKIAGRAYLEGNPEGGRLQDTHILTEKFRSNEYEALANARGSFSGIVYLGSRHRLHLFTDLVGIRPVYLAECGPFFIFSTSFRALTSLSFVDNRVDDIGVMQRAFMGYSTGTRTSLSNVSVLFGSELITIDGSKVDRSRYFKLENTPESTATEPELAETFHRSFIDAVRLRLGHEERHRSLLSGGLDSRLIVSALRTLGAEVETYCMASSGQQDHLFSRLFAEAVGTTHRFIEERDGFRHEADRLRQYTDYQKTIGNRDKAHLLWSGDGGSVGLGFVYIDKDLEKISANDPTRAALHELARMKVSGISRQLMRRSRFEDFKVKLADEIFRAMMISEAETVDKNLRFYYLLNDQRCHLYQSLEDIDLHRIEFVLPFFDAELMKVMASIPTRVGHHHLFYTTVMGRFPDSVRTVPWQSYPNHDPCPLPIPDDLVYQWDEEEVVDRASLRSDALEILRRSFSGHFPALYSRPRVMALSFLEYLGLSNRSYALRPFLALARAMDMKKH